ncbi:MAG TPA: ATP-binding cassette domain-containing protein [Gammaproteobacteria bacterium]|nr:ATP-binding cassette domain-containing protein [Gammaproteobacteria bacterium]
MISIKGLSKVYASGEKAINNLALEIEQGEVLALLGPNGAGKSSTIKVLTTLSGFDDGEVIVSGYNVDVAPDKVRQSIGYVAQETGVDYFLTGRENLTLQGHLYRMTKKDIHSRIDELSNYFELSEHLDNLVSTYSGGMRRKLDIATALIHRPKILFLDEPTLGLDTQSRKSLWTYIHKLNEELGLTMLLTTHYLEEADILANRVAIIDKGEIKTLGKPEELKDQIRGDVVSLHIQQVTNRDAVVTRLQQNDFVKDSKWEEDKLHLYVSNGATAIVKLIEDCKLAGVEVLNVSFSRPTLDDVFIQYTGSSIDAKNEGGEEKWWEKWAGKGGGAWSKKWQQDEASKPDADSASEEQWSAEEAEEWHKNKEWTKEENAEWENNKQWSQQESAAWHNKPKKAESTTPDTTRQWPRDGTTSNQAWKKK